jgi:ribosomal protein S18 acetylase RimI-like enzyme
MGELQARAIERSEIGTIAGMNRQLQADEGAGVLSQADAVARLERWLDGAYRCVVFTVDGETVGYALFRATDPSAEGHPGGVYIRQFFIVPARRGRGWGRKAFGLLRSAILPAGCYITLEALATNPAGRAFWQALGFREYSVRYELDQGAA